MDCNETISNAKMEAEESTEVEIHQTDISMPISNSSEVMETNGVCQKMALEGFSELVKTNIKDLENEDNTSDGDESENSQLNSNDKEVKVTTENPNSDSANLCPEPHLSHQMVFDILLETYFDSNAREDKNHTDYVLNIPIEESDVVPIQPRSPVITPAVTYYEVQLLEEQDTSHPILCNLEEVNEQITLEENLASQVSISPFLIWSFFVHKSFLHILCTNSLCL